MPSGLCCEYIQQRRPTIIRFVPQHEVASLPSLKAANVNGFVLKCDMQLQHTAQASFYYGLKVRYMKRFVFKIY